jgi:hypothetical protein
MCVLRFRTAYAILPHGDLEPCGHWKLTSRLGWLQQHYCLRIVSAVWRHALEVP